MPIASRIVGTTSITWWNCQRMPPLSLILAGQDIAVPCLVPPKKDGICFVHLKGVSKAQAQPIEKWGYVLSLPHTSYHGMFSLAVGLMPLNGKTSFQVPNADPSALLPLSPLI